jgi:fatty-acyl-CoA synthase
MLGLMQEWPLSATRSSITPRGSTRNREVVSRSVEGPIVRTTYADIRIRALKIAQLLAREGCKPGDRIATLAWNTGNHLEAWYGIMGAGGVYHTLNPRLFPDQIAWIMNHAADRGALCRPDFHADRRGGRAEGAVAEENHRDDRRRPHAGDEA